MNEEQERLRRGSDGSENWDKWGPYLSERAWATVREDYSANGDAWGYFPHDHARSRSYRWSEDGIGGISDDKQYLCFAVALWNGRDPILKERLFGLTGTQGNHGEDVKEYYFYLDSTPTHSYCKMLYKYPQAAFPYAQLEYENSWQRRDRSAPEYELADTGVFADNRYFDVFIEYAKASTDDICIKITAYNRGLESATLHLLPTLWFRNTWSWGRDPHRPNLTAKAPDWVSAQSPHIGDYNLYCEQPLDLLFCENETNLTRLYGTPNGTPYPKDGINDYITKGEVGSVNPTQSGTKMAAHFRRKLAPGGGYSLRLRLSRPTHAKPFADFDAIFAARLEEADRFYQDLQPAHLNDETRKVQRQAFAGMLWSKQFYYYIVEDWLQGDPAQLTPPPQRKMGRNWDWPHLYNERVMSMPDKWEYPWYAAWDLAFHCLPLALLDAKFAKDQLDLLTREWYQHPNGALPAYEWNFNDVNPPVFAWAAWRVYKIEEKYNGRGDRAFLETVYHKLLINFTWWVNRKDSAGKNIFQGGFLGLDNIGLFDRSAPPFPNGGYLEQSDATSWMGMYCLNMLRIALELALENPVYENIATKFFEHFLSIANALNRQINQHIGLWDDEDQFFYDVLSLPDGSAMRLRVRSLVGLIPLLAVETIEPELLKRLPGFAERLEWYLTNRPDLAQLVSHWNVPGAGQRRLVALVRGSRMKRLLRHALSEMEFLSPYGLRSLSKHHEQNPVTLEMGGQNFFLKYEPAESSTAMFGGNSNWRGPVWFPINYLLIEALQKFHHYYGDDFKVECPTGSGQFLTLREVADNLSQRLINLFVPDGNGERPFNGSNPYYNHDPHWRDHVLFHEYFHGDNGAGLGASHQTGWTGLVAKLIQQQGEHFE
jgi:hypothetical protein